MKLDFGTEKMIVDFNDYDDEVLTQHCDLVQKLR